MTADRLPPDEQHARLATEIGHLRHALAEASKDMTAAVALATTALEQCASNHGGLRQETVRMRHALGELVTAANKAADAGYVALHGRTS